jgi:hypothetical protein
MLPFPPLSRSEAALRAFYVLTPLFAFSGWESMRSLFWAVLCSSLGLSGFFWFASESWNVLDFIAVKARSTLRLDLFLGPERISGKRKLLGFS